MEEQGRNTIRERIEEELIGWIAIMQSAEGYQLRESPASYNLLFEAENEDIAPDNAVFWNVKDE